MSPLKKSIRLTAEKDVKMRALFTARSLLVGWSVFYLICQAAGRPDVPIKIIWSFHRQVMGDIDKPWGCPSPFNKKACTSWGQGASYEND